MFSDEQFDKITIKIEQKVKFEDKTYSDIAKEISKECGYTTRQISNFFSIFTGQTLTHYIKERKMMAAYENILNSEKYNAEKAVEISGLSDQPAFNKRFKLVFGLTPTEAFEKKDPELFKLKMSWDTIRKERNLRSEQKTIFGINESKYEEIKKIIELQHEYHFDETKSETAYDIYVNYDIPLKDSFSFVDRYYEEEKLKETIFEELEKVSDLFSLSREEDLFPEGEFSLSREEFLNNRIKEDIADPELRHIFLQGNIGSIYTMYNVVDKLHEAGEEDVTQVDIDVINICAYNEINPEYCKKAVAYFKEHATAQYGEDAFEEYVESILRSVPIEIAFENIMFLDGWDDYSQSIALEKENYYPYDYDET